MADQEILAELRASAPRRWMGVAIMAALGGLLIYIALVTPLSLAWQPPIGAWGLSLWLAQATRRATELTLTLTEEGSSIARARPWRRLATLKA